jgi:hypothetical protein
MVLALRNSPHPLDATPTTTGGKMSMELNAESLEKAAEAITDLPQWERSSFLMAQAAITAYLEAEALRLAKELQKILDKQYGPPKD